MTKPRRQTDDNDGAELARRPTLAEMNAAQLHEVRLAATFGRVPRWFVIEVAGMGKR